MEKSSISVVYRRIDSLTAYARNSRTHSAAQVADLAASMKEYGFTNPVLIDPDGGVIAGHGRLQAARLLGYVEAPTITLGHLTETQRRAYVIADNKLALGAGWDQSMLAAEFADLRAAGFNLGLTGFTLDEISAASGAAQAATAAAELRVTLADRFMVPPFSVLNAREGWWQNRKRAWLALGIQSELGRGGTPNIPSHPPTVTQNADGTLNYSGSAGQAARFDKQRQPARGATGG